MDTLEKIIGDFEGSILFGVGEIDDKEGRPLKKFRTLYAPQLFIEENILGGKQEITFDADYNLHEVGATVGDYYQNITEQTKSALKSIESTLLIHDPRYVYEHNKQHIKNLDENIYVVMLDHEGTTKDLGSTKTRIDFVLLSEKLDKIRLLMYDSDCNLLASGEVKFIYDRPEAYEKVKALMSPEPEDSNEQEEEPTSWFWRQN
jgi:hypothetical protein